MTDHESLDISEALDSVLTRLAGAQPAEGTRESGNVWVWVQAFADFDYEYAYLVEVRTEDGDATIIDYLSIFQGYDSQGQHFVRSAWHGQPETYPNIPNLYDALAWWAGWVKTVKRGEQDDV